jgi:hypothetical protein
MIKNKHIWIFLIFTNFVLLCTTVVKHLENRKLDATNAELEARIDQAEVKAKYIATDVLLIQERREILDSLYKFNKQKREDEKIKILERANDSTIKRIVLEHIGAK